MMEIRTKHLAAIIPLVVAAGIGISAALGAWHTTATKEPVRFSSGDFAGEANPADIRGSYTFADVAAAFPAISVAELAKAFDIPLAGAAGFQVKSLEAAAEGTTGGLTIGTDSVRLLVALASGLPYDAVPTTGLPAGAIAMLEAKGTVDPGLLTDARARVLAASAPAPDGPSAQAPVAPATKTVAPAAAPAVTAAKPATAPATAVVKTVKGKTTFKELADWGISDDSLRKLLGGEIGGPGVALKDYAASKGVEFSTLQAGIQALADAAGP